MGFDPGDSAAAYHNPTMRGGETDALSYHWSSGSYLGVVSKHDGQSKALRNIQNGLNEQSLSDKAEAWGRIRSHAGTVHRDLAAAYTKAFQNWSGDDADRARKTFAYTVESARSVHDQADGMQQGTSKLAAMAEQVKSYDSSGPGLLGSLENAGLDTTTPGLIAKAAGVNDNAGGGGANLDRAVNLMSNVIGTARTPMPSQLQWQTKTSAAPVSFGGQRSRGGGAGVGGVSAPGMSSGAAHGGSSLSGIGKPKTLADPTNYGGGTNDDPTDHIGDPTDYNPPGYDPGSGNGSGGGFGGGSGSGYDPSGGGGVPDLDSGSTLAGYDPGGVGAGGGLGAGGGGLGGGAGGGLGAGAGGGLGAGGAGLDSAGMPGAGAGTGGLGAGAATAGGRGGSGAPGMMAPMRGGGPGGNGDERERNTWLSEDEDVWGEDEAPPSIIS